MLTLLCYETTGSVYQQWFSSVKLHSTLAPRLSKDRIKPLRFWSDVDLKMLETQSAAETTSMWRDIVTGEVEKYDGMPLSLSSRTFGIKGPLISQSVVSVNPRCATFSVTFFLARKPPVNSRRRKSPVTHVNPWDDESIQALKKMRELQRTINYVRVYRLLWSVFYRWIVHSAPRAKSKHDT